MEFHFAVISKMTLEQKKGEIKSFLKTADVRLEVSPNLDKSRYLDRDGLPLQDANMPILNTLVVGIVSHMRYAAQKGWMKEGEMMNYVTEQLHRAFVHPSDDPTIATMEY